MYVDVRVNVYDMYVCVYVSLYARYTCTYICIYLCALCVKQRETKRQSERRVAASERKGDGAGKRGREWDAKCRGEKRGTQ